MRPRRSFISPKCSPASGREGRRRGLIPEQGVQIASMHFKERAREKLGDELLQRNLQKIKGKEEWIDPCLALARKLKTDDPRKVLAFLDGRERLMSGDYQQDQIAMYMRGQE